MEPNAAGSIEQAADGNPSTGKTNNARKKRAVGIAIALIVAVGAVAAGVGAYLYDVQQKELYAREHQTYQVLVNLNIEGYTPSDSTPIPVRVTGTDFEGADVAQEIAFKSNGETPIDLMRGDYSISIFSTPILSDGTIFNVEGCSSAFSIADDDADKVEVDIANAPTPIPALEVTDEELAAAEEALSSLGIPSSEVDAFIQSAGNRREAALSEKAAQEQAARQAEAKASFERRLAALDGYVENDARSGGNMMEMADLSYDYFQKLDALMNEVCDYLYEALPADQAASLRSGQESWVQTRNDSQKMAAASLGMASGNSLDIEYNLTGADMMEKRIPELIAMIP